MAENLLRKRINDMLPPCIQLIRQAKKCLVTMHCRPDGDAAGSAIAMMHILEALGKEVTLFNVDEIPSFFTFLNGAEHCVHTLPENPDFDLIVVLDCAEPKLLGKKFPEIPPTAKVLYIDHHAIPYGGADALLHDSAGSAAGELVYHLCLALGVDLTFDIAEAIYVAIVTDTGSFKYSSTTPDALEVTASLLRCGIDVWKVTTLVYENNPREKMILLGKTLDTLWISDCGKLASLHATHAMLRECHCSSAMTDGFINYARSIAGVEVAIFLTQLDENFYRISFRSRGNYDVSVIASHFGGGGHKNAAACTANGTIESLRAEILNLINEI